MLRHFEGSVYPWFSESHVTKLGPWERWLLLAAELVTLSKPFQGNKSLDLLYNIWGKRLSEWNWNWGKFKVGIARSHHMDRTANHSTDRQWSSGEKEKEIKPTSSHSRVKAGSRLCCYIAIIWTLGFSQFVLGFCHYISVICQMFQLDAPYYYLVHFLWWQEYHGSLCHLFYWNLYIESLQYFIW